MNIVDFPAVMSATEGSWTRVSAICCSGQVGQYADFCEDRYQPGTSNVVVMGHGISSVAGKVFGWAHSKTLLYVRIINVVRKLRVLGFFGTIETDGVIFP